MKKCDLTITTTADGVENSITRKGEIELFVTSATVRYTEENAAVCIRLEGERAVIERQGDYSMRLELESGRRRFGTLGINGAEGEIETFTERIQYSIGKDSLLLSMRYDLLVGDEPQKMKIRLFAKIHE